MPGTPAPLGYRLYRLDDKGRIAGPPVELHFLTDEEAITAAGKVARDGAYELWNGSRLVGKFTFADRATLVQAVQTALGVSKKN